MSYVNSTLGTGESIIYNMYHHWMVFFTKRSLFSFGLLGLLDYLTDEMAMTNKRIIVKKGLISRDTLELNISKIESVAVKQGIIGRILGYGTVIISGTGGVRNTLPCISKPMELQSRFNNSIS